MAGPNQPPKIRVTSAGVLAERTLKRRENCGRIPRITCEMASCQNWSGTMTIRARGGRPATNVAMCPLMAHPRSSLFPAAPRSGL